ncbi:CDP-glucose 4,6-dehydratase [Leptospira kanakyensis]|uniref:CDP-glucose 4,6-dehydratase n=1 Tax=Leptospira kanakyensis TaxID=2484968 RepID=UPI00223D131B|nr:CDP-glucose 4,6-dehydratase [Leptospira kanakyensis]MCW7471386.1 CDP-glucose 4,6-dehydratase [Leptospira kanakyensis]
MDSLLNFFKDKKVFVTGHTGFKGSWLTTLLVESGANVTGYALSPQTNPNHFDLLNLKNRINHIEGDIRDFELLNNSVQRSQPDIFLHLAAQALVRLSYEDPLETYSTNVMGSVNVLESVRKCNSIKSLVYVTSDKCYENVEWVWGYREDDKLGGHDPYSASKGAAEVVFSSYLRSFFYNSRIGAASARAGNVIGGGDWSKDRIIPDCIRSIQSNQKIVLRSPNATRPWQHVLEPLSGYLLLAKKLFEEPKKFSGSWNFGPNTHKVKNVYDVAKEVTSVFGKGEISIIQDSSNLHEANLLQLNCDKAHQYLGWYPRWDVDTTLRNTAFWYKRVLEGENAEVVTKEQIHEFFDLGVRYD